MVTVMSERGAPTPVAWTMLRAPESLMSPADPEAMKAAVQASPRWSTYAETVDRESAREKLAARLEEGARKAEEDAKLKEQVRQEKLDAAKRRSSTKAPKEPSGQGGRWGQDDGGVITDVVESKVFKDFMRTAAREIARGMFGSGRR